MTNQEEDKAWLYWQANFANNYDQANYLNASQSKAMQAGHRLAEKRFNSEHHFAKVLEIGAGTGEHLGFINHSFDEYILSDFNQSALDIAEQKLNTQTTKNISYQIQNSNSLRFKDNSFDRLIATHVLEHIYQPHLALQEWKRVVKNKGIITVLIPTDPGIAWRLGRHFGPRRNAISKGVAYDYIMAREHVNPCHNLIPIMRHMFEERHEFWWPFPIALIDLNLFFVAHLIVNK